MTCSAPAPPPPPVALRALRAARDSARPRPRTLAVRRRARARAVRRQRRALHAPARRGPATAGFGLVLMMLGHAVGWPVAAAARRRSPTRWPRCCARSAARSRPAAGSRSLAELRRRARRAVRPDAAPAHSRSPATELPDALPPRAAALSLRARRVQARLRAGRPRALDGGRVPPRRNGACGRHARGDRARQRPRWRGAAAPSAHSCSSPSRACSIRAARRPAPTRCGRTAMCPNGSDVDMPRRDRSSDRALRTRLPRR